MIAAALAHDNVPTQFIDADGVRCAYRRLEAQ
jgi:hypothetical protein